MSYISAITQVDMSEKKTRYQLQKLIDRLKEFEYTVRFEKGNFKTGYCILEDRKIIVVNKFHDVEARIDNLRSILSIITEQREEGVAVHKEAA